MAGKKAEMRLATVIRDIYDRIKIIEKACKFWSSIELDMKVDLSDENKYLKAEVVQLKELVRELSLSPTPKKYDTVIGRINTETHYRFETIDAVCDELSFLNINKVELESENEEIKNRNLTLSNYVKELKHNLLVDRNSSELLKGRIAILNDENNKLILENEKHKKEIKELKKRFELVIDLMNVSEVE